MQINILKYIDIVGPNWNVQTYWKPTIGRAMERQTLDS